jgi:hypothetical protein
MYSNKNPAGVLPNSTFSYQKPQFCLESENFDIFLRAFGMLCGYLLYFTYDSSEYFRVTCFIFPHFGTFYDEIIW